MRTIRKDPDEEIVEGFDWSDRLLGGEGIASSLWEVGAGLTGDNATFDGPETEVELFAGTVGDTYLVTNRITTTDGAVYQKSFKVLVADR